MNKKLFIAISLGMLLAAVAFFAMSDLPQMTAPTSDTPESNQPRSKSAVSGMERYLASAQSGSSNGANSTNVVQSSGMSPGNASRSNFVKSERSSLVAPSFTDADQTYLVRQYEPLTMPNDPAASQDWVVDANLPELWSMPTGGYQTTLAIIDTGFALEHEEFQGRWHQNSAEVGPTANQAASRLNCTDQGLDLDYSCNLVDDDIDGIVDNEIGPAPYENTSRLNCSDQQLSLDKSCNQIDDDGNGYVDDVSGWDVVNQDNSPQAGELSPDGTSTTHGTMVSGVAAATGGNGVGIAGVNWQTKLLPIQALDDDGYGDTRTVAESIYYAINQRADVINISLGTDMHDDYVREAIAAATKAGILVVASSGNDGCDCVVYPAHYPEVLAVGATDATGARADFSSWGQSVDIVAPGTDYLLPAWSVDSPVDGYLSGVAGTSFSSPLVAAVAANLKSHRPEASPLHLTAALRETADRSGVTYIDSHHDSFGYGRIDSAASASRMITTRHLMQSYALTPVSHGNYLTVDGNWELSGAYTVLDCQLATQASMPIYELVLSDDSFFTMSEVERYQAEQAGYTTTRFAYGCLQQQHDTTDVTRLINIYQEFRNINRKY